jgi:plastocyanin
MHRKPVRAFVIAVVTAAAVLLLAAVVRPAARADGGTTFVVQVSEGGFNPSLCKVSRSDSVAFKNVGTGLRRVIFVNRAGGDPIFDTGDIKPGETSRSYTFVDGSTHPFADLHNSAASLNVLTPVFSNTWDPACEPAAGTFPPPPKGCTGAIGCLRLAALARD